MRGNPLFFGVCVGVEGLGLPLDMSHVFRANGRVMGHPVLSRVPPDADYPRKSKGAKHREPFLADGESKKTVPGLWLV